MEMTLLINQIKEMMDAVVFQVFLIILALCGVLYLYFMPFAIAYARGHKYTKTVFLLNLFFGWTGLVWIALLVWSFTGKKRWHNKNRGDTEKSDVMEERLEELLTQI
jgi:membrane protein implicated in regulation of membrane protease activity